jgi:hypothetical protein
MSFAPESQARTRVFARVIGPFLAIYSAIIVDRAPEMPNFVSAFFANGALVWVAGCMLLFLGVLVIAQHQYWSSPPAVVISLIGWIVALRGLELLMAPGPIARLAEHMAGAVVAIRIGCWILLLIGLWLSAVGWGAKGRAA